MAAESQLPRGVHGSVGPDQALLEPSESLLRSHKLGQEPEGYICHVKELTKREAKLFPRKNGRQEQDSTLAALREAGNRCFEDSKRQSQQLKRTVPCPQRVRGAYSCHGLQLEAMLVVEEVPGGQASHTLSVVSVPTRERTTGLLSAPVAKESFSSARSL